MSDYGHFRASLLADIGSGALKPSEVASILLQEADRFPEIRQSEIEALLRRGQRWEPSTTEAA